MGSRWRQENYFRYARMQFDLDSHDAYATTDGVLTVRLDPQPAQRATAAIAQRCEHLTATKTRYPDTELILCYEVKTRP